MTWHWYAFFVVCAATAVAGLSWIIWRADREAQRVRRESDEK